MVRALIILDLLMLAVGTMPERSNVDPSPGSGFPIDVDDACRADGDNEEECSMNLLQRRGAAQQLDARTAASVAPKADVLKTKSQTQKMAVTFEGNGQLALSDYWGVMGGLLAGQISLNGNETLTSLLSAFSHVVSNSGGSWYAGFLIYSEKTLKAQHAIGKFPKSAKVIFNRLYYNQKAQRMFLDGTRESWNQAVLALEDMANIDPTTKLRSDDIPSWAEGKRWILCTSVPVATPTQPRIVNASVTYYLNSTIVELPPYVPGRLNTILTSKNITVAAPFLPSLPFCASPNCFALDKVLLNSFNNDTFTTKVGLNEMFLLPGHVTLLGAMAASSDYLGASPMMSAQQYAWVAPGTYPFVRGYDAVVRRGSGPVIFNATSLIDGYLVDNTGILQAVAAGAGEVTSFLNGFQLDSYLDAASSGDYSIFQESLTHLIDVSSEKRTIIHDIPNKRVPTKITFVIVHATTKDNQWFGIKSGTVVKLNLIIVTSGLDNTWLFKAGRPSLVWGEQVQDIVDALTAPENTETVQWALSNFFHVV